MNHIQEALKVLREAHGKNGKNLSESSGYAKHAASVDKAQSVTDIAKSNKKVAELLSSAKKAAKQQLDHYEAMLKAAGDLNTLLIKIHDELFELDERVSEKFWDSAPVNMDLDARKSPENSIKLAKFIEAMH